MCHSDLVCRSPNAEVVNSQSCTEIEVSSLNAYVVSSYNQVECYYAKELYFAISFVKT